MAAFTCALLHRIVHRDRFRRYHEVGYAVFLQLGVIFAVLLAFVFAADPGQAPLWCRRKIASAWPYNVAQLYVMLAESIRNGNKEPLLLMARCGATG